MSIRDLEIKTCPVKSHVGCTTCYKRYDCRESYFFERMNGTDCILGVMVLIALFVGVTYFTMGGVF